MPPRPRRDRLSVIAGEVDVVVDGVEPAVTPVADGRLVIAPSGTTVDDALVRARRDADQR